jgi:iron complex outermembrane receptor protein
MYKTRLLATAALLSVGVCSHGVTFAQTTPQPPSPPVAADNPPQTAAPAVEVVVVTASRREETIQEAPLAVSAYSGDDLQDQQIDSLVDIASTTPNVQISGAFTNANIAIRGIGNAQVNAGSESGVAVHVDGAYVAQPLLTLSTFLDVNRVEILRGPQGTLFGRNATGGAVNIIPNTPTTETEYGFNASIGVDPDEMRTSGYVSGPLNADGSLLGRVAFQQSYNEGYTRNASGLGPDRLDGQTNYSARGQIEWRPSDGFTSRVSLDYQEGSDSGPGAYLLGTPDASQPLPSQLQGLPRGSVSDRTTYANVGKRDIEALAVTWNNTWAIGDGEVRTLLFYNNTDLAILQDGDGTSADFSTTSFKNGGHEYFGEVLYASDGSQPFSFVAGANYFFESLSQDVSVPIATLPVPVNLGGDIDTTSMAVFAAANLQLSDDLKLFGGVRYTDDAKEISEYNNFVGTLDQDNSWDKFTYEAGASYNFSPDMTGYLKYSTGYKGGGFSAGGLAPAFDPETNTNIEAGLKGDYFDGALTANLAAFHMSYEDLQVNQVIGVSTAVTNAAQATIDGVEADLVWSPVDALRVEASGAWLDATFEEFETADSARPALGVLDLSGNRLPAAPEFNASLGAYYEQPLGAATLTYGARYDWKSRLYFSEFNIPISSQEPVGALDLSLRYTSGDGHWTASLFALNATDEEVKSNVLVVSALIGSLALAQYEPGRQIGASLGFRY